MGKIKKLAIGASVAAAAGYVAGVLTAPKSGKEMRKQIKQEAASSVGDAEKQLKSLHTDLDDLLKDTKGKGSDLNDKAMKEYKKLLDAAKDNKEKVREVLSAIHEGEASDKDLNRALTDAKRALDHLKDYLKK